MGEPATFFSCIVSTSRTRTICEKGKEMNNYWKKYYGSLEGATIVSFDGMEEADFGDGFPTFTIRFSNGEVGQIEISQDPEGNGGGFVFGLPTPEPTKGEK
jgi:hypothetical protein